MTRCLLLLMLLLMGCAPAVVEPITEVRETAVSTTAVVETVIVPTEILAEPPATLTPIPLQPTEMPPPYVPPATREAIRAQSYAPTATSLPSLPADFVFRDSPRRVRRLGEDRRILTVLSRQDLRDFAYHPQTTALAYFHQPSDTGQEVYLKRELYDEPELIFTWTEINWLEHGVWPVITSLAFSKDGSQLAIMLTDRLYLYMLATGEMRQAFQDLDADYTAEDFGQGTVYQYVAEQFVFDDQTLLAGIYYRGGYDSVAIDLQTGVEQSADTSRQTDCSARFRGYVGDNLIMYCSEVATYRDGQIPQTFTHSVSLVAPEANYAAIASISLDPDHNAEVYTYDDRVYVMSFEAYPEPGEPAYRELFEWQPDTGEVTILLAGDFFVYGPGLRMTVRNEQPYFFIRWDQKLFFVDLEAQALVRLD